MIPLLTWRLDSKDQVAFLSSEWTGLAIPTSREQNTQWKTILGSYTKAKVKPAEFIESTGLRVPLGKGDYREPVSEFGAHSESRQLG